MKMELKAHVLALAWAASSVYASPHAWSAPLAETVPGVDNYKEALNWHPDWQPRTEQWIAYMDRRMAQIARIEDTQQRWDGYLVAMQQGLFVQNYTSVGYKVVNCPKKLYSKLRKAFHEKFADKNTVRREGVVDQIHCEGADGNTNSACQGDQQAWMVNTGLNEEVLRELQPLHEEWAGVDLIPSIAYGLRVYKNGSSLTMHTDRLETHVISSILHVDRDYGDQEPWPIVIEGVDGVTTEVDLQPGQLLLYESAKCTHGRPRTFRGNWYTSLFIHYRPTNYNLKPAAERLELVPPSWRSEVLPPLAGLPELTVYGTGFKEHGCAHGWCPLNKEWPAIAAPASLGAGAGGRVGEGAPEPLGSLSTSEDGHNEL